MPTSRSMRPRDVVLLVALAALWGFNFVPIRWALDAVPPFALAAVRFLLAAFPAVLFVARPKAPIGLVVAYGLLIGVGQFGLLFLAIALGMSAGLASLLAQLQVFFTIGIAALALRDPISRQQFAGASVAGIGVALLIYERLAGGASLSLTTLLLVIVSAAFWGVANVIARYLGRRYEVDGFNLVVWSSLASPLPLAAMSLALEGGAKALLSVFTAGPLAWASILFIVVGATLWGFSTWNRMLKRYSAASVTPFALLVPIAGLTSAAIILGEQLTPIEIAAGTTIMAGLAIAIWRRRATPSTAPAAAASGLSSET